MDEYDMYDCDYGYENDGFYQTQKQKSKYQVISQLNVFAQVTDLVNQTSQTVALPFGWSLLILKEFKWQVDNIGMYFQKMKSYQDAIGYSPKLLTAQNAKKEIKKGDCLVCCIGNTKLIMNICKHTFCIDCWAKHIQQQLNNKNPFMRCMSCKVPLLHQIINQILNGTKQKNYNKIYNKYQKIICQFFTNTNRFYQCCPGADCNYCIKCDGYSVSSVKCMCGHSFCFKCKNDDHSPCTCEERSKWIDIVLKQQANAKWIAANAKVCPWCNKAVQRSQGCNFMACTCGKSFCYMCSKPWQPDHKDHFKCHIFKKKEEQDQKRQKWALQKLNHFAQKYLRTNSLAKQLRSIKTFDKRSLLYNKLGISLTQSDFIDDAYKFAIQCCQSLKWIYVYSYFVEIIDKNRKQRIQFSQIQYQSFKEHLLKKLSYDLKMFLTNLQKQIQICGGELPTKRVQQYRNQFSQLKSNIINYYKFTKQFKQKFIQQLQLIDQSLIKRNDDKQNKNVKQKQKQKDNKNKNKKGWF